MNAQTWAVALLQRLGIHPSPGAVRAVVGWERAEGGHWNNQAHYNPLNTTQPMAGAGNTGSQGNIKVYRDWAQGLDATVRTLRNGRYGPILQALQAGNAGGVANAIGQTPWGTSGDLVRRTIGSTPAGSVPSAPNVPSTPEPAASTSTQTVGGVDNSGLRKQALVNFLLDNSKSKDPLDLAVRVKQLADVPGQQVSVPNANPSSPSPGRTSGTPGGPLLEMFWQGQGGVNIKNGRKVPQGFVSGHQDHVHVAAGPNVILQLGKLAQDMGLRVGENVAFGDPPEAGVHTGTSYHYQQRRARNGRRVDRAMDVSGDPQKMAAYARRVAALYGVR